MIPPLTTSYSNNSHTFVSSSPYPPSSPYTTRLPWRLRDDKLCYERLSTPNQGHPHLRIAYLHHILRQNHRGDDDPSQTTRLLLTIIEGGEGSGPDRWLWEDGDEVWLANNILDPHDEDSELDDDKLSASASIYPKAFRSSVSHLTCDDWNRVKEALHRRLTRQDRAHAALPDGPFMRMNVLAWLLLSYPPSDADPMSISDRVIAWHACARNLFRPSPCARIWAQTLDPFFHCEEPHICLNELRNVWDWVDLTDWLWTMSRLYDVDEIEGTCKEMNGCVRCARRLSLLVRQWNYEPTHARHLPPRPPPSPTIPESDPPFILPIHRTPSPASPTSIEPLSVLIYNLATFDTAFCLYKHPSEWLVANTNDIITTIRESKIEQLEEGEMEECVRLVKKTILYPRFLLYTYMKLMSCKRGASQLAGLKSQWERQIDCDDLTSILSWRSIRDTLHRFLQEYKHIPAHSHPDPGTEEELARMYTLDVFAIFAHLLVHLKDPSRRETLLALRGDEAQSLLDLLQTLLDYPTHYSPLMWPVVSALVTLSKDSGLLPQGLAIRGVVRRGQSPVAGGRFSEVYKGVTTDGRAVAIKVLRISAASGSDKLFREYLQEAVIWRQLHHPNLVPFYGVIPDDSPMHVCLVSPWLENGTVVGYLRRFPNANRILLVGDVAHGLQYLHNMNPHITHGDLKGNNILVSPSGRACLVDLGLAGLGDSFMSTHSVHRGCANPRYRAPELYDDEGSRETPASDMHSFAGACYEIFTGLPPFHEIGNGIAVVYKVLTGHTPSRPPEDVCRACGLDDQMWGIMQSCWAQDPQERLTANEVVIRLSRLPSRPRDTRPLGKWDNTVLSHIRPSMMEYPFSSSAENLPAGFHRPGGLPETAHLNFSREPGGQRSMSFSETCPFSQQRGERAPLTRNYHQSRSRTT